MIDGGLFTHDFLLEGIGSTGEWQALDVGQVAEFAHSATALLETLAVRKSPNEAQTEADLVYPLLKELGWTEIDVQPNLSVKARHDVPDALLFGDRAARMGAAELDPWQRIQHGLCIVEVKRWQRPLDRDEKERKDEPGTPSSQMLRYLRRVDDVTRGQVRWGILTNGRMWRLYRHQGGGTAEQFVEIDLGLVLQVPGCEPGLLDRPERGFDDMIAWRKHCLRLFIVLFGRSAFLSSHAGETFHDLARREGQFWEARVAKSLSETVFSEIFPFLANVIASSDPQRQSPASPEYLDEVRHGALILLYRLLFVLYAEDRNLLPDETGNYAAVCLTRMRLEVAALKQSGTAGSEKFFITWSKLLAIFGAIATGDDNLGIPPYNGGLFDPATAPILDRIRISDPAMARIIFGLSHDASDATRPPKYINYRDLSVQQLGSVYERLLEYKLVEDDGRIAVALAAFGRKSSGSYYTPDELVQLIIERTVDPLAVEAMARFVKAVATSSDSATRVRQDPAEAILGLRVCDPAMGSGHFLVSLVDWMTDQVLEAMAAAEALMPGYVSPVAARIETIRVRILAEAEEHKWPIVASHLDNRHIVRRMVLKRCIYGVDLNPMAVELAKVALWLHSFTVGAPLSFLDHHLVCGNSLFGERVRPVMDWAYGGNLLINDMVQKARGAAQAMEKIEDLTDADIAEAKNSKSLFDEVQAVTADLRSFMDLVQGVRWSGGADKARLRAINRLQRGDFGDPVALLKGTVIPPALSPAQENLLAPTAVDKGEKISADTRKALADAQDRQALPGILADVRGAIARERFLHWEVTFPGVWTDWESNEPRGGFDAVIGNPPWDRMKFQEVEWFAERRAEIALSMRASDRKRKVRDLLASGGPVVADYLAAAARSEGSTRVARDSGNYPLLSGGDLNLYSLFVERSMALIKPDGLVGLLTPSGIASDKSAAEFFRSVSTTGRLGSLIDFENRGIFFPDVHNSFKFAMIVMAGPKRRFAETRCAFFLQSVATLADPERAFSLTPDDFAKMNPNTGTAPVFRTRRDAEITAGIYDRLPVLIDRSGAEPVAAWPVRYCTMFHMTNDSHLFVTRSELAQTAYPVAGGRWKRGSEEFVPLYEGKMVQAYDHRAASVVVNAANLNRPAQPVSASETQHADPAWSPDPQFMVPVSALAWPQGLEWALGFKSISAATNIRTMIGGVLPLSAVGNALPLILPADLDPMASKISYNTCAPLIVANLNSVPFDYVVRQKIHGNNLNWYIVEQLPVVPPATYARRFGPKTAEEIIRAEVLALTYTAHDMAPFARDQGFVDPATGEVRPPFVFDAPDRVRRRAKLDAVYFMLYFPSATPADMAALRETAAYIYSTFPIVEREERAAFGRYLSRDLCLLSLNALAAGDPDAMIVLPPGAS